MYFCSVKKPRVVLISMPGGKTLWVHRIVSFLPKHKVYAEPFASGTGVFFAKPPSPVEVLNDIDGHIVNVYRVLQDPKKYEEVLHRLESTLYARSEYMRAKKILVAPDKHTDVDLAWARIVVAKRAFASLATGEKVSWGRQIYSNRSAKAFANLPEHLLYFHERLKLAQIDCIDSIEFIKYWDTPDTLFYIDPPYISSTRKLKRIYAKELPDEYHERLVDTIINIKGKAVVSHYLHPIYERLEGYGYERYEFHTVAHMSGIARSHELYGEERIRSRVAPRVECLWVKKDECEKGGEAMEGNGRVEGTLF